MLLVELIKHYAGRHKTDKAILNYLNTEDVIAMLDSYIHVENVTDEWLLSCELLSKTSIFGTSNNLKRPLGRFFIVYKVNM